MKLLKISETQMINVEHVRRMNIFEDESWNGMTYYLRIVYANGDHDDFDLCTDDKKVAINKLNEMLNEIK